MKTNGVRALLLCASVMAVLLTAYAVRSLWGGYSRIDEEQSGAVLPGGNDSPSSDGDGSGGGSGSLSRAVVGAQLAEAPEGNTGDLGERVVSVRGFLEDYYGDRWSQMRALFEAQGVDLDAEQDLRFVSPEAEAQAALRDQFLLDAEELEEDLRGQLMKAAVGGTAEEVLTRMGASPTIMARLGELNDSEKYSLGEYIAGFDGPLTEAAHELIQQEARLRQALWENKLVGYGPFVPVDWSPPASGIHQGKSVSISVDIWTMSARLDPSLDPLYGDAHDRYHHLLAERTQGVFSRLRR